MQCGFFLLSKIYCVFLPPRVFHALTKFHAKYNEKLWTWRAASANPYQSSPYGRFCKTSILEHFEIVLSCTVLTSLNSISIYLPNFNISVFEISVLIQMKILNNIAHVINYAIENWKQAKNDDSDHVLLHAQNLIGAGCWKADKRKNYWHAPNIFPPKIENYFPTHDTNNFAFMLTIRALVLSVLQFLK